MLIIVGTAYATALLTGACLVMGADRRRQWHAKLRITLVGFIVWPGSRIDALTHKRTLFTSRLAHAMATSGTSLRQHKRSVLLTSILLLAPAVIAPWLAFRTGPTQYEELPSATDPVITALLKGEHLVPPPALPPQVFTTREIAAERQHIASASREWQALDAEFRQRLLAVYRLMAQHGYQMTLLEGYRSPERQTLLAKLGSHVTNARAYQSYHQYGLAADSAFYREGKVWISEKDPWAMEGYRLYGTYAESVGLTWGGRWRMMDFGHVELKRPHVLQRQ
ncbi:MAG TPA: M15 family metallopeptidase [Noviherbaspirillum sp.]|nr:M15 family metallopeptidase [Noviherbaspirillum sp.]